MRHLLGSQGYSSNKKLQQQSRLLWLRDKLRLGKRSLRESHWAALSSEVLLIRGCNMHSPPALWNSAIKCQSQYLACSYSCGLFWIIERYSCGHRNCCAGICQHLLVHSNCFGRLLWGFVSVKTVCGGFLQTACGRTPLTNLFALSCRRTFSVVVLSLWLLLQEPQKRARGRERHILQRPLHVLFRDPVRGQFPSRNRDLRAREPALQHPDAGPAGAERAGSHAAAGGDAPQDWHAPCENLWSAGARGCEKESEQGEDDSRAGAGEMYPRLPAH